MSVLRSPKVLHRSVTIDGVRVFYRESVPVDAPPGADRPNLLLLHGFPSASHQYRRLIDALGGRYRMVAPDYPGFGYSDAPAASSVGGSFAYTFDHLADILEGFVEAVDMAPAVLYLFDFGAPIGFRLATRHPDWVRALIVQNANAYLEGLSESAHRFVSLQPDDEGAEDAVRDLLTPAATRAQYETGVGDLRLVAPDGWTLDQHFLDQPGRKEIQRELAFDYKSNLALYSTWQAWLRQADPPTLIVWGRRDPIFPSRGRGRI